MQARKPAVVQQFSLLPFAAVDSFSIGISGTVSRSLSALQIRFSIGGELEKIALPEPAEQRLRRHNLWQQTCFEAFFGAEGLTSYRELNLSPDGDWNVYRFDDERMGMRQDPAIPDLEATCRYGSKRMDLELRVDLAGLGLTAIPLRLGLSAVLLPHDGSLSYWALAHLKPTPDFHDRRSWLILL